MFVVCVVCLLLCLFACAWFVFVIGAWCFVLFVGCLFVIVFVLCLFGVLVMLLRYYVLFVSVPLFGVDGFFIYLYIDCV